VKRESGMWWFKAAVWWWFKAWWTVNSQKVLFRALKKTY
jgi:hypothetical protein